MKLTGNLKKQVEATATKEEAREAIRNAGMELTDDELDQVAGGGIDGFNLMSGDTCRCSVCGKDLSRAEWKANGYFCNAHKPQ